MARCVVAEAELGLVPRPQAARPAGAAVRLAGRALWMRWLPAWKPKPSAVELMDSMLIELTAGNLSLRDTMALIEAGRRRCSWSSSAATTPAEVVVRVYDLKRRLSGRPGVTAAVPALDPVPRDPLWNLRSAAMPLLYGMPGDRKPITFVEDAAVAPAPAAGVRRRFRDLLQGATAPTARSTATPASAACTSGRCST